ncbi:hypothetical protein QYE76_050909 [Lolium multiflorum]|uniref:F-box domain-containing protein n=1 Tax=Lolium multiflorum TaxID=4521 RepID=A0AAD8SRU7_LOLMU|nr:hypothetical protein QYE76_050909 [Lolium multiflorum]
MESHQATMPKAARATATRRGSLPDEIVIWEILVRLPAKPLLRCRAVCRAWRRITSARDFLLAHHDHQPSLAIFSGHNPWIRGVHYHSILAFDPRAATDNDRLHAVAQLDDVFYPQASCDGLLLLSKLGSIGSTSRLSICNPATHQHAPLPGPPWNFSTMGMYPHRPTGEYRLLLQRERCKVVPDLPPNKDQPGCYVLTLGSGQPPRYIGWPETASWIFNVPVRTHDCLHWYPVYYPESDSNPYDPACGIKFMVFDTIAESFREMHQPVVSNYSYIFDMGGTLGVYTHDHSAQVIDIHVLQNYESEVWDLKYRIKLPVAEIKSLVGDFDNYRDSDVISVDGGVLLLVTISEWLFHIDSDGKLVNSFYRGRDGLSMHGCRLKQSLVEHTFFPALEGYAVNASPFI